MKAPITNPAVSRGRVSWRVAAVGVAMTAAAFFAGRWMAPGAPAPAGSIGKKAMVSAAVVSSPSPPTTVRETSETRPSEGAAWKQRWLESSAKRDLPAGETACAALLRELAARDPAEAIRLALLETNWRLRGIFLRSALHGWAGVAPEAAAGWTLANLREGERRAAVEEIVAGAMARPEEAIRAVGSLCAGDPPMASDYGNILIMELTRTGEFHTAAGFAAAAPAAWRNYWLGTAFFQWAQHQPEQAIEGLREISDPASRAEAWQSTVSGWASSDPAALVGYAARLPVGEGRTAALREGLQQWVTADPVAAVKWMEHLEAGAEFDTGAAALATVSELVANKPEVAASWAKSIGDIELRSSTLADVLRQWGSRDPAAARRYAAASEDLRPGDKSNLIADLDSSGP